LRAEYSEGRRESNEAPPWLRLFFGTPAAAVWRGSVFSQAAPPLADRLTFVHWHCRLTKECDLYEALSAASRRESFDCVRFESA
jgi:hypothetical protein